MRCVARTRACRSIKKALFHQADWPRFAVTRREEQLRALQTQLRAVQAAAVVPQARAQRYTAHESATLTVRASLSSVGGGLRPRGGGRGGARGGAAGGVRGPRRAPLARAAARARFRSCQLVLAFWRLRSDLHATPPELRVGCRLHLVARLEGERRRAEAAADSARRRAAAFAKKAEGMAAVETAAASAADACAAQVARAAAALETQRAARATAAARAHDDLAAATAEAERAAAARDEAQARQQAYVPPHRFASRTFLVRQS